MVSESTTLLDNENENTTNTFRSAKRKSNLRVNIFLFESVIVSSLYLYSIYGWKFVSSSSYNNTTTPLQAHVLAVFGVMYMIRLNVMTIWLLPRELGIEELTFVILVWIPSIMGSYVALAKNVSNVILVVAFLLYGLGSYLNTYSELQRKEWKQNPSNKGRCYTLGLFSSSRNINYFGDTMLFAGWAVATGNVVNAWAPIVMGLTFYYFHIPDKELYLASRYARDWPDYTAQTPYAFVPFLC